MANVEGTKAAILKQESPVGLKSLIEQSSKELGRALPQHMQPERLVRIALTCIRQTPDLQLCTPESFLGALFTAAQLGLEPVAGRAYILPYNNNRRKPDGSWHSVKEAQFMVGYKGLVDLYFRHAKAGQLDWGTVCANDEFDFKLGTNAFLNHRPRLTNRGDAIGYWAMATLVSGGTPFKVMSKEDCLIHGMQHSKTFDKKKNAFYENSPWATETDGMCLKTVLIQLMKLLPLSAELQKAISADETSRDYRQGISDMFDLPPNSLSTSEPPPEPEPPPTATPTKEAA